MKTTYFQLNFHSAKAKSQIKKEARQAGKSMNTFILEKIFPKFSSNSTASLRDLQKTIDYMGSRYFPKGSNIKYNPIPEVISNKVGWRCEVCKKLAAWEVWEDGEDHKICDYCLRQKAGKQYPSISKKLKRINDDSDNEKIAG